VIRVHLKGHFAPSHFAAVYWRAKAKRGEDVRGRIINTSSEAGSTASRPGQLLAAKRARLDDPGARRELERYGVP